MKGKYPIPLYLNQKYVFDLLAMMEGGLSQIETVRSSTSHGEESGRDSGGELGVRNVFALLGVSLSGSSKRFQESGAAEEITRERVHTPNSLFSRVRERLWEEGHVTAVEALDALKPGAFVEFSATLTKNPLVDALESMQSLLRMASIFVEPGKGQGQERKGRDVHVARGANRAFLDQFELLLKQLQDKGGIDIIGRMLNPASARAILTLDPAFLSDPSLSDLLDGEYTVFGKVTKVLRADGDEGINLLRKTSLGKVQGPLLEQMKNALSGMDEAGLAVPELATEIRGPAIQVLPIAIFS